jgi:ornithine--oxo-acid transaminase
MMDQARKLALTSRAFRNDQLPLLPKELCQLVGYEMMLPMSSGAEAVETALKAARNWGYQMKGMPHGQVEVIGSTGNSHGRSTSVISLSASKQCRDGFGPFTPDSKLVPYRDADVLERTITNETVAFLFEPVQGDGASSFHPGGIFDV